MYRNFALHARTQSSLQQSRHHLIDDPAINRKAYISEDEDCIPQSVFFKLIHNPLWKASFQSEFKRILSEMAMWWNYLPARRQWYHVCQSGLLHLEPDVEHLNLISYAKIQFKLYQADGDRENNYEVCYQNIPGIYGPSLHSNQQHCRTYPAACR